MLLDADGNPFSYEQETMEKLVDILRARLEAEPTHVMPAPALFIHLYHTFPEGKPLLMAMRVTGLVNSHPSIFRIVESVPVTKLGLVARNASAQATRNKSAEDWRNPSAQATRNTSAQVAMTNSGDSHSTHAAAEQVAKDILAILVAAGGQLNIAQLFSQTYRQPALDRRFAALHMRPMEFVLHFPQFFRLDDRDVVSTVDNKTPSAATAHSKAADFAPVNDHDAQGQPADVVSVPDVEDFVDVDTAVQPTDVGNVPKLGDLVNFDPADAALQPADVVDAAGLMDLVHAVATDRDEAFVGQQVDDKVAFDDVRPDSGNLSGETIEQQAADIGITGNESPEPPYFEPEPVPPDFE